MKKLFQTFAKAIAVCAMVFALSFSFLASSASAQPGPYGFPSFYSYYGGGFFPNQGFPGFGFFPYGGSYGTMNPDADDTTNADEDADADADEDEDEDAADADEAKGYRPFFGGMNGAGAMKGYGGGANYHGHHPFLGGMKTWDGPAGATTKDAPADTTTKDSSAQASTNTSSAS